MDAILSILRRFKAQHSLRTTPLIFAHGTILAAAAASATHLPEDLSFIFAFHNALEELSHTWMIAGQARQGLQSLLEEEKVGFEQSVLTVSPPSQATEFTSSAADISGMYNDHNNAVNYLPVEFQDVRFDTECFDMLSNGAFGAADSYWPMVEMVNGVGDAESIIFSYPEACSVPKT